MEGGEYQRKWEVWKENAFRGFAGRGIGIAEGKEEDGAKGIAWDKEAKEEEPKGSLSHFIFNYLFASVLKWFFFREAIIDSWSCWEASKYQLK